MKVPMEALKPFVRGGRRLRVGDTFNADGESEAKIWTALGRAKRQEPRRQHYETRVMTAAAQHRETRSAGSAAPDLDAMDAEALRALARERGIPVHYRAGAEKIREALREASSQ